MEQSHSIRLIVCREINRNECPWLERTYFPGELVYKYNGPTYGCVARSALAVTELENKIFFFQVPKDSVIAF